MEDVGLFPDRSGAGRFLAAALAGHAGKSSIVLAIPRGGVVVGHEIARAFGLPLDVIIPRKIGAPGNPELAIGAMTEDETIILDEELVDMLGVPEKFINEEANRQKLEIGRRLRFYRGSRPYPDLKGHRVIIVDDGIATGLTMKAALASIRRRGAKNVTIAIPVGPPSAVNELEREADMVVCLRTPEYFQAVGQFYRDFTQVTDEEVVGILKADWQGPGPGKISHTG